MPQIIRNLIKLIMNKHKVLTRVSVGLYSPRASDRMWPEGRAFLNFSGRFFFLFWGSLRVDSSRRGERFLPEFLRLLSLVCSVSLIVIDWDICRILRPGTKFRVAMSLHGKVLQLFNRRVFFVIQKGLFRKRGVRSAESKQKLKNKKINKKLKKIEIKEFKSELKEQLNT